MKIINTIALIVLAVFTITAQEDYQTFLSVSNTGVKEFYEMYPEYDGRGTIILILDTGVNIGIEGLTKTSNGEVKFIDVQEFTHQGDVQLFEADVDKEDGKTIFKDDDDKYKVISSSPLKYLPKDDKYYIGGFDEMRLLNSHSGAGDLNGDGDMEDVYVMVVYESSEGSESFWVVNLDLNGNGDISDDKPLRNYREKQDAFAFQYPGDLTPLTMGLNVLPEEKIVSLQGRSNQPSDNGSNRKSRCAEG